MVTMTDETPDTDDFEAFQQAVENIAGNTTGGPMLRRGAKHRGGPSLSHGGDRDLWEALGYPAELTYQDYREWYERGGIAKTIVEKPAATTWKERPRLTDRDDVDDPTELEDATGFESDVQELWDATGEAGLSRGLRHYFERADILGRIGRFSVLFLGLADAETAEDLAGPVDDSQLSSPSDLLYVTPLGEGDVDISEWVDDPTEPRNGLPELYSLNLSNGSKSQTEDVHHSRVIHVPEGVVDNDVYGEPALRPVINRLHDIEKIAGSAAEAYWRVSNPGLALSTDPELQDVPTDKMDEQVEQWEHKLKRVIKLYGTDVEQLDAQDVSPGDALDSELKLTAGTVGIPQRKLVGSERGELASSMDEASYLGFISERQTSFAEPAMVRPFFRRLIGFGVVSSPRDGTFSVHWPELFSLTELEQAEVKKTQAEAAAAASPMGDIASLHSTEALRQFSPIDEPEDATPPDEEPDPDDGIDEDDEEVIEQFEELQNLDPEDLPPAHGEADD